jgi:gamma-glutamylcysteine synthetase
MATKIETLKKPNGDQVLPRTRAKAVSMESGTTVEAAIADANTAIENIDNAISNINTKADELNEAITQKSQVQIITWGADD